MRKILYFNSSISPPILFSSVLGKLRKRIWRARRTCPRAVQERRYWPDVHLIRHRQNSRWNLQKQKLQTACFVATLNRKELLFCLMQQNSADCVHNWLVNKTEMRPRKLKPLYHRVLEESVPSQGCWAVWLWCRQNQLEKLHIHQSSILEGVSAMFIHVNGAI